MQVWKGVTHVDLHTRLVGWDYREGFFKGFYLSQLLSIRLIVRFTGRIDFSTEWVVVCQVKISLIVGQKDIVTLRVFDVFIGKAAGSLPWVVEVLILVRRQSLSLVFGAYRLTFAIQSQVVWETTVSCVFLGVKSLNSSLNCISTTTHSDLGLRKSSGDLLRANTRWNEERSLTLSRIIRLDLIARSVVDVWCSSHNALVAWSAFDLLVV